MKFNPKIAIIVAACGFFAGWMAFAAYKLNEAYTPPATPSMTVEEAISAVILGHPHSRTVCHDNGTNTGFFIYYPPDSPPGTFGEGWYYVNEKFYRTGAGKWYVAGLTDNEYSVVYPNTEGLDCKDNNGRK